MKVYGGGPGVGADVEASDDFSGCALQLPAPGTTPAFIHAA